MTEIIGCLGIPIIFMRHSPLVLHSFFIGPEGLFARTAMANGSRIIGEKENLNSTLEKNNFFILNLLDALSIIDNTGSTVLLETSYVIIDHQQNQSFYFFSVFKEIFCSIVAGILGPISGTIAFILIYHPLHDIYSIHSEVTFTILFAIYLLIIWSGDRRSQQNTVPRSTSFHWSTWFLLTHLVLHYTVFLLLPVFFDPEKEVAIGLRERIGPCDEYVDLHTVFGKVR